MRAWLTTKEAFSAVYIHPPPDYAALFHAETGDFGKFLELLRSADVASALQVINERYLHWDDLRHRPHLCPAGFSIQQTWFALAMGRNQQYTELPISFDDNSYLKMWHPLKVLEYLHKIDQLGGGNLGAANRYVVSQIQSERYLVSSLMEEAIASSQLEGAVTTRQKAKDMLRSRRKPRNQGEQMIANNYRAINEIRESLSDPLTPAFLLHIQSVLTEKTLDVSAVGRFRTDADAICIEDARTGESIYTPPEEFWIADRVQEICDFANESSSGPFIHPVVRAITLHFAIGLVHPFVDGNGRTARAIFYWYMLKHGYWLFEYLPISRIFLRAPAQYSRAYLLTETDHGDLTYFIVYHLKVIVKAIKELHEYLQEDQDRQHDAVSLLEIYPAINERQAMLIEDALRRPQATYDIGTYRGAHQVAYATARSDLMKLVDMGALEKIEGGKAFKFRPARHLQSTIEKKKKKARVRMRSNRLIRNRSERLASKTPDLPLFAHLKQIATNDAE